jgi:hypothetical protein
MYSGFFCEIFLSADAIQEPFQQNVVDIGLVVSEEKIFFKFHPPLFSNLNLAGMVPG